jgi:hypothetical protein
MLAVALDGCLPIGGNDALGVNLSRLTIWATCPTRHRKTRTNESVIGHMTREWSPPKMLM